MFRTVLAAMVLASPTLVLAADEFESDFQKAVISVGAEYVAARDRLVSTATEEALKKKRESSDFQVKIVAGAVLGWKQNGKLYKERTTAETFVTRTGATLFQWVADQDAFNGPLLPLGMEMLVKNSAGEPGQLAGQRIIWAAAGKKEFADLDLLFAYLLQTPGGDAKAVPAVTDPKVASGQKKEAVSSRRPDTVVLVAQTIAGMPIEQVPTKKVIETLYTLGKHQDRGNKAASVLANALLRAFTNMSPQEKSELMSELISESRLLGAVGPEISLRVAGTIGGPEASQALEKYLKAAGKDAKDDKDVEKQVWAFPLLRRMRDGSGVTVLRGYATDSKMPSKGRIVALENLGGVKYTEEISATLKSVLEDSASPVEVRFEALRSLDQLLRANRGNAEIAGALRTVIVETTFAPDEASGLLKPAQEIKDIARE